MNDARMREILQKYRRIAVVGLSPVSNRPSNGVTRYMINHGYEIYGVRPASPPEVLGRPCVEKIEDLPSDVDIIDVFRNPDAVPGLVDELEKWMKALPAERRPKVLWLQEGVGNPQAEAKAEKLGLEVVSDRCILKEHARLV